MLFLHIIMIQELFFELIRVAIGSQDTLSRPPSAEEWKQLYDMAKKQSLVGICFAGVQRLQQHRQEPPEMLYLTWMGMAAKIQQRNEVVNRQCVDLQKRLSSDGFESSILKGQGIGSLYGQQLSVLRQSGDIDVWIPIGMQASMDWISNNFGEVEFDYINAHVPLFVDTEVELHWRVNNFNNLFLNRKLQRWLGEQKDNILGESVRLANGQTIVTPTIEFNLFYILLHIYGHEFSEGVGLRQLMDYFFLLISNERNLAIDENVRALYKSFGLMKFASGVMWIMHYVYGMASKFYICEPDANEGRFLLIEIMANGNFGHHDERIRRVGKGRIQALFSGLQHNWHLATHYPSEFFWAPVWLVYHYLWKRIIKN